MRYCLPALFAIACLGAEDATVPVAGTAAPDQLQLDASYAIGRDIGLKIGGVVREYKLDKDRFMAGLQSVLSGGESEMDAAKMQEVLAAFENRQRQLMAERAQRDAQEAPLRKEKNVAWLKENGSKEGVVTLASGLQYQIVKSGDAAGASPTMGVQVECHYTGTLLDGTVFDSSIERGVPASFAVGNLIAGWNEALQMMKPGDHWKLFIPSELAYGEQAPPNIGANQILIFDLQLLRVLN